MTRRCGGKLESVRPSSDAIAASTPPARCGTPAAASPISTPDKRPQQSEIVALAEMADAEDLAGELGEAGAERHVVVVEHGLAEAVGIVPRQASERR